MPASFRLVDQIRARVEAHIREKERERLVAAARREFRRRMVVSAIVGTAIFTALLVMGRWFS